MDEDQNTHSIVDESVVRLLKGLPAPLQEFVTGPEKDAVVLGLSEKYNLHVDQAGEFERAFLLMLLGAYTPSEFVDTLKKVGVAEAVIQGLAHDVNEEVFKPLREEEIRRSRLPKKPAYTPAPPQVGVMQVPVAIPNPAPAPAPIPQPTTPQMVSVSATSVAVSNTPLVRTMQSDMAQVQAAPHGGGFHVPMMESSFTPARSFQTASIPTQTPSAPAAPTPAMAVPSADANRFTVPEVPSTPAQPLANYTVAPAPPGEGRAPLAKEYGNDPYREPVS